MQTDLLEYLCSRKGCCGRPSGVVFIMYYTCDWYGENDIDRYDMACIVRTVLDSRWLARTITGYTCHLMYLCT